MQTLTPIQIEDMQSTKQQIRCLISNVYDLQRMRIAVGGRLVASFRAQMGELEEIDASENPEAAEADEKAKKKLTDILTKEYGRIQDAVAEHAISVRKSIQKLQGVEDSLQYIRSEIDFKLVESYMLLVKSEEESIKVLNKYVQDHPLWDNFFNDIKGCGTLMSAVCIAYLDIRKARHVSSFFKYCGLDTVQDTDKEGNPLFVTLDGMHTKVRQKICYTYHADGENYFGRVIKTGEFDAEGSEIITSDTGEILDSTFVMRNGEFIYENPETGAEYVGDVAVSQHGRRLGDVEMVKYIDKNGQEAWKRGLTYNPLVKTKLMGVLTGCLLKAKDPTYSTIYYDYRARLDGQEKTKSYTDGHKNMMAQRYMIKQFLRNLWVTWRTLEGLEVTEPYEVAKLGHAPHKYNQYHTDNATVKHA